jgi:hypothetical protein
MSSISEANNLVGHAWSKFLDRARDSARQHPEQTVAAVVGFGLGLHLLPLRPIVKTLGFMAAPLVPPVLLTLGAMKAYELYHASRASGQPDMVSGV